MRNTKNLVGITLLTGGLLAFSITSFGAPGDTIYETCPDIDDAGDVRCYPIEFTSKTELHPTNGVPIVAYLFVPNELPTHALPAVVFAHGSGSMFSSGNHNDGLNNKHEQWVRQFTAEFGIPSLHVSSFQSRYYRLPDTVGDQRMFDWENPPAPDTMGGDDYRATSTAGGQDDDDTYVNIPFDPNADDWKDQSNGRGGISEILERPYDLDAAYDYLVGIIDGTTLENPRGETLAVGFTSGVTEKINNLVPGLVIDPERVFSLGTSHGGQTQMALAHKPRMTASEHPMGNHPRYAAHFIYYSGCGLYGAYGGADEDSTWLPGVPVINLHGENDDIWVEDDGETTRERWENGECAPRIANAHADPDMNVFLETVLMFNAEHSFGGSEVGDGDDWYAKVFTDYEVVLPIMDAIGWITWAKRGGVSTVPALSDFGLVGNSTTFTTLPIKAAIPPYDSYTTAVNDGIINIVDLRNFTLDLETVFDERTNEGVLTFTLLDNNRPEEISLADSMLETTLDETTINGLANDEVIDRVTLRIENDKGGETVASVDIRYDSGNAGYLQLLQPVRVRDNGGHTAVAQGDTLNLNLRGLFTTQYARSTGHVLSFFERDGFNGDLALDIKGNLTGSLPALPHTVRAGVVAGGDMPEFDITLSQGDTENLVEVTVAFVGLAEISPVTATVDLPDYSDLSIIPGVPSSGPLTLDGSDDGWDYTPPDDGSDDAPAGDDPTGDDPTGDDPTGDDPTGDDPTGDDPAGDNPTGDDPAGDNPGGNSGDDSGSGSGGGVFLWLLPIALLIRKHG